MKFLKKLFGIKEPAKVEHFKGAKKAAKKTAKKKTKTKKKK